MSRFYFNDSNLPRSPALVAKLQAGIREPRDLFDQLAVQLRFPDYFGANWDGLEECIRDLSWLPPGPVVLKHRDLPLANDVTSLKIYLSILSDAVEEKWTIPGQRLPDLAVLFPADTRQQIDFLIRVIKRHEAGQ